MALHTRLHHLLQGRFPLNPLRGFACENSSCRAHNILRHSVLAILVPSKSRSGAAARRTSQIEQDEDESRGDAETAKIQTNWI